jgi:hypothetical protein
MDILIHNIFGMLNRKHILNIHIRIYIYIYIGNYRHICPVSLGIHTQKQRIGWTSG